jgi:acetate kinase
MREVLPAIRISPDAQLAIEMYVYRIKQTIGAMAATLGGLDYLAFTAGGRRAFGGDFVRESARTWIS